MSPRREERIVYLQGDRRRTEWQRESLHALWPNGPCVTYHESRSALIEICENDTSRAFTLDLDHHTYAPIVMSRKLGVEQVRALRDRAPKLDMPTRPTVLHEITTVEHGARKTAFGYTARHVTTTDKVIPLEGSENISPKESITDGWYIDLETRISCDPQREPPREGMTYSSARLMVGSATGEAGSRSASPVNLMHTTYIGKPETGFAVSVRTTRRSSIQEREQVITSEIEVTELSAANLDPHLFEVPKNFRRVERNLPIPHFALWARWLAWAHPSLDPDRAAVLKPSNHYLLTIICVKVQPQDSHLNLSCGFAFVAV